MIQRILAGRYELQENIGGGGMADVYRAYDKLLDRSVAVKILHPQLANDAEFIEKFRREATGAAKLTHPNIVNIYDVGEDNGSQYIIMEYVAGHTLKEVIQSQGHIEPQLAVKFAKEIASALEAAHRNNLVHCDIKPHNILVMEDGHIKVTDFGIARAVSSCTMTYNGNVMGSVHYFSPEQAKGTAISPKSDIYSLGVVLYEMLTGELPYNGETAISIALKHLQEEPVAIRQLQPSVPPVLEAIVQKAMAKDPAMRPTSTEMFKDLEQAKAMLAVKGNMGGVAGGEASDPFATQVIPRVTPEMLQKQAANVQPPVHTGGSAPRYNRQVEEKSDSVLKSKKFIIGLLSIVFLGFFVGAFLSFGKFWSSAEVTVPDVVGKSAILAQQMLEDKNLRVKVVEATDPEVPVGDVISQYPEAGATVKEQRMVTITVSKGGEAVSMPDLKGMSRSNAEEKLKKLGLKLGAVYEENSKEEPGTVINQDPRSGSKLTKGQTVDITVSKGEKKKQVTIQNYAGLSVESAKANIEVNGMKLGSVTEQDSDKPAGTVVGQSPAAGSSANEGDTVSLVISSGRQGSAGGSSPKPSAPASQGKTDSSRLTVKTE
ncbi:MAG: Stk1 family PASTA domain-containing Ser/Thr kinase [Selenomonadaceae bacterium]|nr:Stk1 family PASTA domain-containing Ser/Thr kinase [Selenomonadaceae bacterium]